MLLPGTSLWLILKPAIEVKCHILQYHTIGFFTSEAAAARACGAAMQQTPNSYACADAAESLDHAPGPLDGLPAVADALIKCVKAHVLVRARTAQTD